jgi:hypothetical protein
MNDKDKEHPGCMWVILICWFGLGILLPYEILKDLWPLLRNNFFWGSLELLGAAVLVFGGISLFFAILFTLYTASPPLPPHLMPIKPVDEPLHQTFLWGFALTFSFLVVASVGLVIFPLVTAFIYLYLQIIKPWMKTHNGLFR